MRLFTFILALFMLLPTIANEDIPPAMGDIHKNIHILFDQSGSMSLSEYQAALGQIEMIVAQAFDEFNLKVTAFASSHSTLIPRASEGFDVLEENPSWMSLPSKNNLDKVTEWLSHKQVNTSSTVLSQAILSALAENTEGLTIIIVSDCIIDDWDSIADNIKSAQAERAKTYSVATIGFINVSDSSLAVSTTSKIRRLYDICRPNRWFWMSVRE